MRSGIVQDPKEYRWSGYGEAVGRGGRSLDGICKLFCGMDLNKGRALAQYRKTLYYEGVRKLNEFTGAVSKPGFARDVADKVLDEGGELSVPQLLHCRARYLMDGVIIGGREFVDKMLAESGQFSALRRKRGARQMRSGACEWNGLCMAGELRSSWRGAL